MALTFIYTLRSEVSLITNGVHCSFLPIVYQKFALICNIISIPINSPRKSRFLDYLVLFCAQVRQLILT